MLNKLRSYMPKYLRYCLWKPGWKKTKKNTENSVGKRQGVEGEWDTEKETKFNLNNDGRRTRNNTGEVYTGPGL